jgi:uncharacterized membrane protein
MFSKGMKYLWVYFLSMFKFAGGPVSGIAFGLSWIEICVFTVLGMMTSVLVFSALGERIKKHMFKRFYRKRKLFTKRNRRIVQIWRRFGLAGVAFLTPVIFSPIIGTMVAASFGESKQKIFMYMLVSALFWGVVMSLLANQLSLLLQHVSELMG